MQFIALLIALAMVQYLGSAALLQKDHWFYQLLQKSQQQFAKHALLAALLPVVGASVALLVLLFLLGDWFWGLGELVISVAVLLYAFGRGEFNELLIEYRDAWREGRLDELQRLVSVVDSTYQAADNETMNYTHVAARDAFLYAGFQRLFAVLFCFAILGPVAAFFYRLLSLAVQSINNEQLLKIQQIIEWPAARLMALSFVVVGDFSKGLAACSSSIFHPSMTNQQVISVAALASSGLDLNWLSDKFYESHDNKSLAIKASEEIGVIKQLLVRSLALAVIGFALFQLF
jgi:membrane protein required for beta-lactamase induction